MLLKSFHIKHDAMLLKPFHITLSSPCYRSSQAERAKPRWLSLPAVILSAPFFSGRCGGSGVGGEPGNRCAVYRFRFRSFLLGVVFRVCSPVSMLAMPRVSAAAVPLLR
jgi:hypothetical protein